ncbi:hypothetical protein ACP70R_029777 [Stipagrostis hirtigluma subsp. patula]
MGIVSRSAQPWRERGQPALWGARPWREREVGKAVGHLGLHRQCANVGRDTMLGALLDSSSTTIGGGGVGGAVAWTTSAARWGAFDGDRLRLPASVPGLAIKDGTAIHAAPNGRCCALRSSADSVRWSSWSKLMNRKVPGEESWYPKLATHDGQFFSSMSDSISMFIGLEYVLTSTLRRRHGDAIYNF